MIWATWQNNFCRRESMSSLPISQLRTMNDLNSFQRIIFLFQSSYIREVPKANKMKGDQLQQIKSKFYRHTSGPCSDIHKEDSWTALHTICYQPSIAINSFCSWWGQKNPRLDYSWLYLIQYDSFQEWAEEIFQLPRSTLISVLRDLCLNKKSSKIHGNEKLINYNSLWVQIYLGCQVRIEFFIMLMCSPTLQNVCLAVKQLLKTAIIKKVIVCIICWSHSSTIS